MELPQVLIDVFAQYGIAGMLLYMLFQERKDRAKMESTIADRLASILTTHTQILSGLKESIQHLVQQHQQNK